MIVVIASSKALRSRVFVKGLEAEHALNPAHQVHLVPKRFRKRGDRPCARDPPSWQRSLCALARWPLFFVPCRCCRMLQVAVLLTSTSPSWIAAPLAHLGDRP